MRAKFKCDCSGHILEMVFFKDGDLHLILSDRYSKKTKFKVKGWLGDIVLTDWRKSKELSKFKKFVGSIKLKGRASL